MVLLRFIANTKEEQHVKMCRQTFLQRDKCGSHRMGGGYGFASGRERMEEILRCQS